MPVRDNHPHLVRSVEGVSGTVDMHMDLAVRFDYGEIVPWVTSNEGLTRLHGRSRLGRPVAPGRHGRQGPAHGGGLHRLREAALPLHAGWYPSHEEPPPPLDSLLRGTPHRGLWTEWATQCCYEGPYQDAVVRSLITLKALTYEPTGRHRGGGHHLAARGPRRRRGTGTTATAGCATPRSPSSHSCGAGYYDEAMAWRDWLLRAVAGDASKLQIMYGLAGERRLDEWEVSWLPGYEDSVPVRIGNAAAEQFQLDVYGEVMSALYASAQVRGRAQPRGLGPPDAADRVPREGVAGARRRHLGGARARAATSRTPRSWPGWPSTGPCDARGVARPRRTGRSSGGRLRKEIHDEVCEKGFNTDSRRFTQYYGSDELDASVLMIPLVGFLPAHRSAGGEHDRSHRARPDGRRLRAALPHRRHAARSTGSPAARARFWPARSGWSTASHMIGRDDDAQDSSSGCSPCATTWACCPRSTTPWRVGWWATSPRPSPTCP